MSSQKLVDKSVTNIFWSYLAFFSTKLLNLIAIVIIARLLSPAEFGVMAVALAIMGYFELATAFGLGASLISAKDDEVDEAANAVFWISLILALTLASLLWLVSAPLGAGFGNPEIGDVLDVLAVTLLLHAGSAVHSSLLRRDLRFRRKLGPNVIRGLVKGLSAIALALLGFGVWALVWGHLLGVLAHTVAMIVVRPWRPRGLPSRRAMASALRYGAHLVAAGLINHLPGSLDTIAIGKFLGGGAAGLYSVASRMPDLAISAFTLVAGGVAHPVMAQLQDDRALLQAYYYGLLRYSLLMMLPASVALALVTPPLIQLLYLPKWHDMIVPMQIICIGLGLGSINLIPGVVYKAISRTDNLLFTALINLPFVVIFIVVAATMSLEAVAFAKVLLVFVKYTPNFYFLRRAIGVTVGDALRATIPGAICAVAVAAGATIGLQLAPEPAIARLAMGAAGAALAWVAAVAAVAPEVLTQALRLWRRKILRRL